MMFYKLACLAAISTTLFSCTPTPGDSVNAVKPTKQMATASNTPLHQLEAGYGVYMTQCYQCHEQPDPSTFTAQQWKNIVPFMSDHAGLPDKDRDTVLKYLRDRARHLGIVGSSRFRRHGVQP